MVVLWVHKLSRKAFRYLKLEVRKISQTWTDFFKSDNHHDLQSDGDMDLVSPCLSRVKNSYYSEFRMHHKASCFLDDGGKWISLYIFL